MSFCFNYGLIERNKRYCVALSGGADSVALLNAIVTYSKEFPISVSAIHVNHNLRKEAKRDEQFCIELCKKLGVELEVCSYQVSDYAQNNGLSVETAGRELRYQSFAKIVDENRSDYILLAHHKDDKVEGILLNLFKGASIHGLIGLSEKRGAYIRPMLAISKDEILDYIEENCLSFVQDDTNFESDYERNYLRNSIVPLLKTKFPSFSDRIISLSELAQIDDEYLQSRAREFVGVDGECVKVSLSAFVEAAIAPRAVLFALNLLGVKKDVYRKNLEAVTALARFNDNGVKIDLPCGIIASREYTCIALYRRDKLTEDVELKVEPCVMAVGNKVLQCVLSDNFEKRKDITYIDFDKLNFNAIIRKRKEGDVFNRTVGRVKLKEYLIDKKIPSRVRDELLVIANGSEIDAVIGLECGKNLLIDDTTKNILKIKYE